MSSSYREEEDFLGAVRVPKDALYGAFTTRAKDNFEISGLRIDSEFIETLAEIKKAAATINSKLGFLEHDLKEAIVKAADEVTSGKHGNEFPLDVFQAGAGTPWNMNMNEVLANRANQILGYKLGEYNPVHPNDHVNMAQSSNDVIPNAIRITTLKLFRGLDAGLERLEKALMEKAGEFSDVRKSGRTHTQDAVPITLGQEMTAYSKAVANNRRRIEESTNHIRRIFLGGTAVGTGLNTHPDYPKLIRNKLEEMTGIELTKAEDFIEKTQFASDFLDFIDSLSCLAVDLLKICNDLMLLSSGPRTGLRELALPEVEPGSSIMPGKVNPSILECVNMVLFQVMGNRTAVENAAKFGTLDLNVYTPAVASNTFNSTKWLTSAVRILTEDCIDGLQANREVTGYYFEYSNAVATLMSPVIGYERAAKIAKDAVKKGMIVRDLVVEEGLMTEEEVEELIEHSCEPNLLVIRRILNGRRRANDQET